MKSDNDLNSEIIKNLNALKVFPDRDPQKTAAGRKAFLDQAAKSATTVSPEGFRRHKNRKENNPINLFERRKERGPMLSTFASIILAISLLLGGSGATIAAAQASEPGDLLYNIKLLSETAALDLTVNPESQLEIALDLVDRRSNEIINLLANGEVITDGIQARFSEQIERTFILALNMPQDKAVQALIKIQDRLKIQEQTLLQSKTNGSAEALMALTQTHAMLQERLRILEDSQMNLLQIMEQLRIQEQINNPENGNSPTNYGDIAQNTPYPSEGNSSTPGSPSPMNGNGQEGNSPWFAETQSSDETDISGNGQNTISGTGSPQENQQMNTTKTVVPNSGVNGSSGTQNGNQ
ncbi:MAG: hypothetical protein CVU42_06385 [Chloroflexi bacterium HGW-Chloroflexi-4]|jgi:hypothetical protein|nr:MAG: hypothetical protein CVU42_06385 [Chloroflexi bacterium HGW-Chloroflexi-4]